MTNTGQEMEENDCKKDDKDDELTDDSTEVLLAKGRSDDTNSSSLFPGFMSSFPLAFLKSYRSSNPQSRVTPFAVVLLFMISFVYILNQADRLVLAVLIPSGLQCINEEDNGTNDTCVTEDHNSQFDNGNESDCIKFDNFQQGILTGPAFTILYVISGLPLAWLADTQSRSLVFLGGIAFWSTMVILMGFINNFWELLLLRILLGVGEV